MPSVTSPFTLGKGAQGVRWLVGHNTAAAPADLCSLNPNLPPRSAARQPGARSSPCSSAQRRKRSGPNGRRVLDSLLTTKLRIPDPPQGLVPRPRLREALDRGGLDHRLTLVSAPAGYGKTTLLADWAHTSQKPIGWLSLSKDEDDLEGFLRHLFHAWKRVRPEIADSRLAILLGSASPDPQTALAALLNAASELPADQVLILDDYHLLQNRAVHDGMAFLLDHLPPHLHFVLGTRAEPPLPLARYRARGQLLEIRLDDLRFTAPEAAEFVSRRMGLELKDEDIKSLNDRVEGWAAGLQLAALSLQHGRSGASFSGRQRFVADYLKEDVFQQLPRDVQGFLLRTSVLERLSGPLCDAVMGEPGGQEMLERLERENLFVHRLDDERRWFRYHPLFAEYLLAELGARTPSEIPELHRRAAHWYAAHAMPEQAFGHAVAGGDVALVTALCERHVPEKIGRGEFNLVRRWLESLPERWYAEQPALTLARAGWLGATGEFEAFARHIEEVERGLAGVESEQARRLRARVTAFRCAAACMQNDLSRAEEFGRRAARELPDDDVFFRELMNLAMGDSYRQAGRWQEARERYLEGFRISQGGSVHALGALADLNLRQGLLGQAADLWEKALRIIQGEESWGSLPLPAVGWAFIRLAEIAYERDERERARDLLARGLERAELGGDVRGMIAGHLLAGRIALTGGESESASAHLEQARPLVEQAQFSDWKSRFERFQLELWLAQDRLRAAVQWCDRMQQDGALDARPENEVAQLAVARVLIVKGDPPSLERARVLLRRLLEAAEVEGRAGVAIEALALEALTGWKRGDRAGALASLEESLRLAEPEGYLRLFADLGLPMGRLLQEARSRSLLPEYVEALLAAFGSGLPGSMSAEALPEPLTAREQEVLELIASGLTNREIAGKLVISAETVKKHTANIFSKLRVSNRTQAVARGRDLDLLA